METSNMENISKYFMLNYWGDRVRVEDGGTKVQNKTVAKR